MLIGSQIFPGLWGRNFVGRKFGIISNACIYVQGYTLKPQILVPHEQW